MWLTQLVLVATVFLLATHSHAGVIVANYTGTVSSVDGFDVNVGDSISGSFTYDDEQEGSSISNNYSTRVRLTDSAIVDTVEFVFFERMLLGANPSVWTTFLLDLEDTLNQTGVLPGDYGFGLPGITIASVLDNLNVADFNQNLGQLIKEIRPLTSNPQFTTNRLEFVFTSISGDPASISAPEPGSLTILPASR